MNKFSVIEVNDASWSSFVNRCFQFDFYHTQSYNLLEANRPILCVGTFGEDFIALPLILREIPDSDLFDCTSAYGYCGPISNLDFNDISTENIEAFKHELVLFFKENNIVSSFSRLHPLISSGTFFNNFGEVVNLNKTVAIDLRIPEDEQKKQFRKSNKSELNQLRRKGYEVVEATTDEEIDRFIEIYYETMTRVNASDSYFFSRQYFHEFLKNKCFQNKLLIAKKDNLIAAGAIFTITGKIMQYHLAGTTEMYIKETPMKLILDEARLLGNGLGLEFLHLGGGVGGSDEDSLFKFKSGFSDTRFTFSIWKYIVDQEIYNELVRKQKDLKDIKENFFPLYRG